MILVKDFLSAGVGMGLLGSYCELAADNPHILAVGRCLIPAQAGLLGIPDHRLNQLLRKDFDAPSLYYPRASRLAVCYSPLLQYASPARPLCPSRFVSSAAS